MPVPDLQHALALIDQQEIDEAQHVKGVEIGRIGGGDKP